MSVSMKTVKMKYGAGSVEVSVPEKNLIGVIEKSVPEVKETEEEIILKALAGPIGTPRLGEIVKPGQTVAIVVSDVTRLWQRMNIYLPYIVRELNQAGIRDENIRFIGAMGFHRGQSREEHEKLLGEELKDRFVIHDHDCEDKGNLTFLGTTGRGTPVWINKMAMDSDHIVLTGGCTYHPFVGWGGGKKSILPGIVGLDTIQHNHRMVLSGTSAGTPTSRGIRFTKT
jgi:nickel-dependent lactate racemase